MAVNVHVRVLDSVSGEGRLSPVPPMYPDMAPSAIKGERQAPLESSGCSSQKTEGVGGETAPNVCSWLEGQKQGSGSFV